MLYYHVAIGFPDKKETQRLIFHFGLAEAVVKERITNPYMKNQPFLFAGQIIQPSSVNRIFIFKSKEGQAKKMILPNGKNALDEEDNFYILKCFLEGRVKDVSYCTRYFITSAPQEGKEPVKEPTEALARKEKVFIVHGRDETQALRLQKYLAKTLNLDAEIFEDFKERSGSNTIIEQLECIRKNVGYAFIIVTPDDLGCLREEIEKCRTNMLVGRKSITVKSVCKILDNLNSRARQNVVFEHGLFIGELGRDNVCCLLQTTTKEKPSDIEGILYVGFSKSVKETFPEITEKLKNAGFVKT